MQLILDKYTKLFKIIGGYIQYEKIVFLASNGNEEIAD